MNRKFAAVCVLSALLAAPEAGWTKKKDKDGNPWDGGYGKPGPPGQTKNPGGGPPSWAPAHGYRAKQQYFYYPRYNVYKDPVSGLFFSFHGGAWRKGSLPPNLNPKHLGRNYRIEGDLDEPYRGNSQHKKKYKR